VYSNWTLVEWKGFEEDPSILYLKSLKRTNRSMRWGDALAAIGGFIVLIKSLLGSCVFSVNERYLKKHMFENLYKIRPDEDFSADSPGCGAICSSGLACCKGCCSKMTSCCSGCCKKVFSCCGSGDKGGKEKKGKGGKGKKGGKKDKAEDKKKKKDEEEE
jgi:hypothetical protein